MKYLSTLASVLVLVGVPVLANAADNATKDSRYSYAQVAYVPYQEFKAHPYDGNADGMSASLSYHFVDQAYIFGRGIFSNLDDGSDYTAYSAGLGLRGSLGDTWKSRDDAGNVDIYTEFSYENLQLDTQARFAGLAVKAKGEGDGFAAAVGLRWQATPWLEINPYGGYLNYLKPEWTLSISGRHASGRADDDLDGARYGVRAVLNLGFRLAAVASFERTELGIEGADLNENTARAGIRWYFPSRGFDVR